MRCLLSWKVGVFVFFCLVGTSAGLAKELTTEESRTKAAAEFPDLSNPSSVFAKAYAAEEAQLRTSQAGFFSDNNWPLMLAYRVAMKLGVRSASPAESTASQQANAATPPLDTSASEDEVTAAQGISPFILTIKTDQGSGSGFVLRRGDKFYLVTNRHVIEGGSNIRAASIDKEFPLPSLLYVSRTRDIVMAEIDSFTEGLVAEDDFSRVRIGDATISLGNSSGAGVARLTKGKLLGMGNDLIETDAAYVKGNSGSPIVHLKSGKVLGVVTYVRRSPNDRLVADSDLKDLRHFAYRIDNIGSSDLMAVSKEDFSSSNDAVEAVNARNGKIGAAMAEAQRLPPPFSSAVFRQLGLDFTRGAKFLGMEDIPTDSTIDCMVFYQKTRLCEALEQRLQMIDSLELGKHDRSIYIRTSGSGAMKQVDMRDNVQRALDRARR